MSTNTYNNNMANNAIYFPAISTSLLVAGSDVWRLCTNSGTLYRDYITAECVFSDIIMLMKCLILQV